MTKKSDYDLMIRVRHSEKSALSISARLNEIDARIKYHEDRKSADKKLAKIAEASAATVGLAGFRTKTRSGSLTAGGRHRP